MWIEEAEWNRTQRIMPIVCVDAVVVRLTEARSLSHVGLILRDTPHEGWKWCTVGGRMLYGETLDEALCRHLFDTLGEGIDIIPVHGDMPMYIAQYYPGVEPADGFDGADPRKHAIGLTYCVGVEGEIMPRNEAKDFRWFPIAEVANHPEIGFRQNDIISSCCRRLQTRLRERNAYTWNL